MVRGGIWTVSGGPDYTSKPRPVVVVQADAFGDLDSVTVCPLTSDPKDLPLFRIVVAPNARNGLNLMSRIMIDKVTTVSRSKLETPVGQLGEQDIVRLNRAIVVFLGLAG